MELVSRILDGSILYSARGEPLGPSFYRGRVTQDDRIERLEEEKAALTADIREVYSEAKGVGFDTKVMRQVVRMRRLDRAERQELEAVLDLYLSALGMRS